MTNFEKIKAMSIEEMAEKIYWDIGSEECNLCPVNMLCGKFDSLRCVYKIKIWLESEVEE